ncbi:MAG: aminoacyl-tRNA hydrolase [Candidatus Nomurabacteria bacterium]|jgi:PTH1 family peptidyl-tRNA hydrolase|nr:aminoacyl-tRNA hydrolase [Candidatus Nomurabacteria bacterium]
MKLIIGLGNPGTEYIDTRHNLGWAAVDNLAKKYGAKWVKKSKFSAEIADVTIDDEKIILAKPQTFYNLSGDAAQKIKLFYNLNNSDILVVHDDIDLPVGIIRTRIGGSDAGNGGVKDLISKIGSDFARLRIGSGQTPNQDGLTRPEIDHRDYVLGRPTSIEKTKLDQLMPQIDDIVAGFIVNKFTPDTMTPGT